MGLFSKPPGEWNYTDENGVSYFLNYKMMTLALGKNVGGPAQILEMYQVRRRHDGVWQMRPHIEALQSQATLEVEELIRDGKQDAASAAVALWDARFERYDVDQPWSDLSGPLCQRG
jgi:hypothetical protein